MEVEQMDEEAKKQWRVRDASGTVRVAPTPEQAFSHLWTCDGPRTNARTQREAVSCWANGKVPTWTEIAEPGQLFAHEQVGAAIERERVRCAGWACFLHVQWGDDKLPEAEAEYWFGKREGAHDIHKRIISGEVLTAEQQYLESASRWPRRVVAWFAERMEGKLLENDHKGGWHDEHPSDLYERLLEEARELKEALMLGAESYDIVREAADVANIAMMLADNAASDGVPR